METDRRRPVLRLEVGQEGTNIVSSRRETLSDLHGQVNRSLKILRERNDVRGVLGILETCIRSNFAGVESPR